MNHDQSWYPTIVLTIVRCSHLLVSVLLGGWQPLSPFYKAYECNYCSPLSRLFVWTIIQYIHIGNHWIPWNIIIYTIIILSNNQSESWTTLISQNLKPSRVSSGEIPGFPLGNPMFSLWKSQGASRWEIPWPRSLPEVWGVAGAILSVPLTSVIRRPAVTRGDLRDDPGTTRESTGAPGKASGNISLVGGLMDILRLFSQM